MIISFNSALSSEESELFLVVMLFPLTIHWNIERTPSIIFDFSHNYSLTTVSTIFWEPIQERHNLS